MVKTKWLLVSIAVALVVGLGGGLAIDRASTIESVRRAEKQLANAQESGRAIALEADRLRTELERGKALIRGIEETNRALNESNKRLAEENQRTIDSVQRAIENVGDINSTSSDIVESIERITKLVNSLEEIYYELRN